MGQIFVTFSEYLNFTYPSLLFPQFLTPPQKKMFTYFMDSPLAGQPRSSRAQATVNTACIVYYYYQLP